jgi:5,5'-dehydrodivanillate O-demethylase
MLRKMFKENMKKVANGEDPIGTVREKHDRIDLPCEKDKFGAEREFAEAWITLGSSRYSPIKQELLDLHNNAWANREKASAQA